MIGFLAVEAWTEASKLSASDLISSYEELPIKSIIYTDINKDGMLSGPNLGLIENTSVSFDTKDFATLSILFVIEVDVFGFITQIFFKMIIKICCIKRNFI